MNWRDLERKTKRFNLNHYGCDVKHGPKLFYHKHFSWNKSRMCDIHDSCINQKSPSQGLSSSSVYLGYYTTKQDTSVDTNRLNSNKIWFHFLEINTRTNTKPTNVIIG